MQVIEMAIWCIAITRFNVGHVGQLILLIQ